MPERFNQNRVKEERKENESFNVLVQLMFRQLSHEIKKRSTVN